MASKTISTFKTLLDFPDFEIDEPLTGTFAVEKRRLLPGVDGSQYWELTLYDYTGTLGVYGPATLWPSDKLRPGVPVPIYIRFVPNRFGGFSPIAVPSDLCPTESRPALELLLPAHHAPDLNDLERLVDLARSFTVEAYYSFLEWVFSDRALALDFVTLPASKGCHHAHLGGLLAHSLDVAEGVKAGARPMAGCIIMKEAAILVGLFHDVGKIILSRPGAFRIPCPHRKHAWLIEYALSEPLRRLQQAHTDAFHAVWLVIQAYRDKAHYDVPLAALISALDSYSAQTAALATDAPAPTHRYWQPGCDGRHLWRPQPPSAP